MIPSDSYLIELRIGYPRWKLIKPIQEVAEKFHLTYETPRVPHMSLYGSFRIKDGFTIRDVKWAIEKVAHHYGFLPYVIDGWNFKKGNSGHVIAFNVLPSPELRSLTTAMVNNLLPITQPKNSWDHQPGNTWHHITLAFKLTDEKFEKILDELRKREPDMGILKKLFPFFFKNPTNAKKKHIPSLHIPVDALRITILHRGLIAAEYDLTTKKWLDRPNAKSNHQLGITLKTYRIKKGLELTQPHYYPDKTIYTIADLHLNHPNIIKHCCRPFLFTNVHEMNRVLINNWNYTVKPNDYVFFVGDLCLDSPEDYLTKLNGNITFIEGNHDSQIITKKAQHQYNYHGIDFLFVHKPDQAPEDYPGWIIHGHEHNNKIKQYPFFNPKNRRINVGVELVKYQPMRLKYLYDLIKSNTGMIPYL